MFKVVTAEYFGNCLKNSGGKCSEEFVRICNCSCASTENIKEIHDLFCLSVLSTLQGVKLV